MSTAARARGRRSAGAALVAGLALALACGGDARPVSAEGSGGVPPDSVEALVRAHARAWEEGDTALVRRIVHEEALLAYPRRRVDRETWIRELAAFAETHDSTRVRVHRVLVDGDRFAVEWTFATTELPAGVRIAVSDAILGQVRDGRIVLWKEYLDGRVPELQRKGLLPLEEGEEPFPWPRVPKETPGP